jgi:predicted phage-related endonuclease
VSRFTIIDAEQRSEMWLAARAGRVTASKAAAVLAKIKSGEAAARRDYRCQLVVERLTGQPAEDGYTNKEIQRGIDLEPAAIGEWEVNSGLIARRTGFLQMNELMAGCSLDADVNNFQGIVEVKCPKTATHLEYLKARRLPTEYVPQCTHQMWVTGAEWLDFVSYDDRLPEGLQYFCVRVYREEFKKEFETYEPELLKFLSEVDSEVQALQKLRAA